MTSSDEDSLVEEWSAERLIHASYKDLGTPAQVEERFFRHLLKCCRPDLEILLSANSATTRDYSLELDMFDLCWEDAVLGQLLLKYPSTLLPLLENAIVQAQKHLLLGNQQNPSWAVKGDKGTAKGVPATRVHARLVHLPPTCCRTSVARMDATDVGKIVQLSGTVVRTSPVQMYESARTYKCTGKNGCSRTFLQKADLEQRSNALVTPERCPLILDTGQRCQGTNLQLEKNGSVHTDYQEIKIQEAASKIGIGSIPRSLLIKLQHDLVDKCQPGDEITVVGSLLAQWQQPSVQPGIECNVGMAIEAHSIQVVQDNGSSAWKQSSGESNHSMQMENYKKEFDTYWNDPRRRVEYPIAARDFICRAVCPKLYGLQIIKLALLITLIGGVSSSAYPMDEDLSGNVETESRRGVPTSSAQTNAPEPFRMIHNDTFAETRPDVYWNGSLDISPASKKRSGDNLVQTRRRDMSHILLIGDPGTGKSQILRFAAALCPRAVLTTGVGTTSAGLTCAAVREGNDKEFALEAGALVLADKGICCIDEFGCIRNEDRTTIHEAMEQQTLSVAKAGIVCKLNCRATVIAVMNPRDCIYDDQASLSANTGLGTPLLSRFDLIFKLVDSSDPERDSNVTTYLLNRAIQVSSNQQSQDADNSSFSCLSFFEKGTGFDCTSNGTGSSEDAPWSMEKLRAYISIVKDRFQPEISDSAALLLENHYEKVRSSQSFVIPVTVRFLESLIRLTQAHARLMYRNVATLEDAVAVLRVMECSAYAYGFDGNVNDVDDFMYRDPMSMDTSDLSPDEDFVVFEYRILKRYGMLNLMPEAKRQLASDLLEGADQDTTNTSFGGGFNWQGIEDARDIHQDHYGRSYYSPVSNRANKRPRT